MECRLVFAEFVNIHMQALNVDLIIAVAKILENGDSQG